MALKVNTTTVFNNSAKIPYTQVSGFPQLVTSASSTPTGDGTNPIGGTGTYCYAFSFSGGSLVATFDTNCACVCACCCCCACCCNC